MKDKIINFLKQPIIYIMLFCVVAQAFIYKTIPSYVMTPDSNTYTITYRGHIFKGELDYERTPAYPYFTKIVKVIGGEEDWFNNIAIAQKLLFLVTIVLFYYCMRLITKNRILLTIFTVIFGVCPYLILWNVLVLTEAISIFEITLLSYITIKYLKKPSNLLAFSMGIIILFMIMTRPSFIYLLPIYILFWILKFFIDKRRKKKSLYRNGIAYNL